MERYGGLLFGYRGYWACLGNGVRWGNHSPRAIECLSPELVPDLATEAKRGVQR